MEQCFVSDCTALGILDESLCSFSQSFKFQWLPYIARGLTPPIPTFCLHNMCCVANDFYNKVRLLSRISRLVYNEDGVCLLRG